MRQPIERCASARARTKRGAVAWLAVLAPLVAATLPVAAEAALTLVLDANGSGPGEELFTAYTVVWDPVGDRVIVPSYENSLVFAVSDTGPGTFSGEVLIDASGDGVNPLEGPWGVAVGPDGTVYVSGDGSHNVFAITQAGAISQILDTNGAGVGQALLGPRDIAVSTAGHVYVSGHVSNNVFEVRSGGAITEIVDANGDGLGHPLVGPLGIAVDLVGNVFVAGHFSNNVFRVDPQGVIERVVDATGDGQGNTLSRPWGLALTSQGELVVAGHQSNNVLVRNAAGIVSEVLDSTGDGSTSLLAPVGVATDFGGAIYVAASISDAVFQIRPLQAPVVAADASGDGQGNPLIGPWGLAVDEFGNLLVTGVFSSNVFGGAPPPFDPVPGVVGPGLGVLLGVLLGLGIRRLARR